MSRPAHRAGGIALVLALIATPVVAADGRLLGWVEDGGGSPMPGVVISLFGKGIEGGGLVTLSDSSGRFLLSSLPAGSYTLRALLEGDAGAASRRVTVLPNEDSVFTLNLQPPGEVAHATDELSSSTEPASIRELRWLLRRKKRSVLEQQEQTAPVETQDEPVVVTAAASRQAPAWTRVDGVVEVLANPWTMQGDGERASLGALSLEGQLSDSLRWRLAGLLAESEARTWRSAAEFFFDGQQGHALHAGIGYGQQALRPFFSSPEEWESRTIGALFVNDTITLSDSLRAKVGARLTYLGFLKDSTRFDPAVALEYDVDEQTRVHGAWTNSTVAPGGDLLLVSSLSAAPDMAMASVARDLEPEHVARYELGVDRRVGASSVGAFGFIETADDPLVNVAGDRRTLRILNGSAYATRGVGLSFARRFGAVVGSVTYRYGSAHATVAGDTLLDWGKAGFSQADFHDVVTRLETFIDQSDTRLVAFYRINRLQPDTEFGVSHSSRFDVRLQQGLPFLPSMTRANWELLLAYRNLFYDESEGALLDELAVVDPARQLIGGIAIRF